MSCCLKGCPSRLDLSLPVGADHTSHQFSLLVNSVNLRAGILMSADGKYLPCNKAWENGTEAAAGVGC